MSSIMIVMSCWIQKIFGLEFWCLKMCQVLEPKKEAHLDLDGRWASP